MSQQESPSLAIQERLDQAEEEAIASLPWMPQDPRQRRRREREERRREAAAKTAVMNSSNTSGGEQQQQQQQGASRDHDGGREFDDDDGDDDESSWDSEEEERRRVQFQVRLGIVCTVVVVSVISAITCLVLFLDPPGSLPYERSCNRSVFPSRNGSILHIWTCGNYWWNNKTWIPDPEVIRTYNESVNPVLWKPGETEHV